MILYCLAALVLDLVLKKKWKNEASWARHTSEFGQGPMRSHGSGLPFKEGALNLWAISG